MRLLFRFSIFAKTNYIIMKFITTLLLFISISVFAQSKTGTIDIDYIVTQMPEFTEAQATVDTYGANLDTDLQVKLKSYNDLLDQYKEGEAGFNEAQLQEKQQALFTMENEIKNFRSNGVKLIDIKRDEALRPLFKKIGVALEVVAKQHGYTLIMQTNESMVYIDANTDVTRKVISQLGIALKE